MLGARAPVARPSPVTEVARGPADHYRPAIDGLRAIAVGAVFLFHLNRAWLPGGFVGVDVFFVISGFLITSLLLRERAHGTLSLARFYQRRIARLGPALFSVALATLIGAWLVYAPQDLASAGANLAASVLSVENFKVMMQGNYFRLSPDGQPYLHYWSLSVEEQFYLVFPVTLLAVSRVAERHKAAVLTALGVASLVGCIALTRSRSEWAFLLLPTRAWELLAGGVLAVWAAGRSPRDGRRIGAAGLLGVALIAASTLVIHDDASFPGWIAGLPVLGSVLVLVPVGEGGSWIERALSTRPMVALGRHSYSLYLIHWPVFSLVDYAGYRQPSGVRLALKIAVAAVLTVLSFRFVEQPGRAYLNHPRRRPIAFACLAAALVTLVPLGLWVRKDNYLNATVADIERGGLLFNRGATRGSIVLMGDSNGSMYGSMARDLAERLGLRLAVISIAAGDPLPRPDGAQPELWLRSLEVLERNRPDFLLLVCDWRGKVSEDRAKLAAAIAALQQRAGHLILVTEPPEIPDGALREGIRAGSRPPYREDPEERDQRLTSNALVKSFASERVTVVDVEPLFAEPNGALIVTDADGRLYHQDNTHLSVWGARQVEGPILAAIEAVRPDLRR